MDMKHYTLMEQREIPEYHGTGYVYRHDKTGARVFYLHTQEDDNKVFSISFCTPPENDKGIPHILEHCVLNGSRKYPMKEPFVELLKGSLNTFLNAMTFPDKTMFPVASRNDQDFMNLMDVYLDAVLYPNLRHDPFILKQEGWHYDIGEENEPITYKGVVYNEMKGAFSSPETVLGDTTDKILYPQTIYANSSGGNPPSIPDLSYEEFVNFHKTYYHPSNSYIFFYGNGDMAKHLAFLDEAYLQDFEVSDRIGQIKSQEPFPAMREADVPYALAEGEETEGKAILSYNWVVGRATDPLNYYGLDMLAQMLGCSESAPVKTALLKAGIGKEVYAMADCSMLQPRISIVAKHADLSQKEAFVRVVEETLQNVVENGFDPKLTEATLSSNEFSLREANYGGMPKGLMIDITCMDSWLYGESPLKLLGYEEVLKEIRATERFFENKIEKEMLANPHKAIVCLKPEPGLTQQMDEAVREKLAAYKAGLSKEEIAELVADTLNIRGRQQTPDAPEALAKLPQLTLEDIDPKQEIYLAEEKQPGGQKAYVYHGFTNHIAYWNLRFNMDYVPAEDLPYAGLLASVLGMMDTEHYSYAELDNEIGCRLGNLHTDVLVMDKLDGSFTPYFYLGTKYLIKENEAAWELAKEVLLRTKLTDKARLKEIVAEDRLRMERSMMGAGHSTAVNRAMSYFSPISAYREKISGVDYYLFLKGLDENFDTKAEETLAALERVRDILLRRSLVSLTLTCEAEEKAVVMDSYVDFGAALAEGMSEQASSEPVRIKPEPKNEGFITSGKVQYVAKAGAFSGPYEGAMIVLGKIMEFDYLWNKVRVQGGAYGCMQRIDRLGRIGLVSYRDPNLEQTLEVFEKAGDELMLFDCSEREMTKYILGAVSNLDPALTISTKGAAACSRLETGFTPEMLQRQRDEVLSVTPAKIRECAKALAEAMQQPYVCVQGSSEKIRENAARFDNIITLF